MRRRSRFTTTAAYGIATLFAVASACAHGLHSCASRGAASWSRAREGHDAARTVRLARGACVGRCACRAAGFVPLAPAGRSRGPAAAPHIWSLRAPTGACPACLFLSAHQSIPSAPAGLESHPDISPQVPQPLRFDRVARSELPVLSHAPPSIA